MRCRLERVAQSRAAGVDFGSVAFSSVFSDHMLVAEYVDGEWQEPVIRAYGELSLLPSISALQYAVSIFEGLKAHRRNDGRVLLFRPRDNARRLNRSAARLAMPAVPEEMFVEGLRELLRVDQQWVPPANTGALYIRPCLFSTDPSVRVKPAERFLFVIFTFPFANYYSGPVDVLVTEQYVRAFPGGTGDVKPAGNYAPCLIVDAQAQELGFSTVMWLDGESRQYIEECGVMNVFFVLGQGEDLHVVTPKLSGTILPGITRATAITLLREMDLAVEERRIGIDELLTLHQAGRLAECFGTGTAATVSHIRSIRYRDEDLVLPPVEIRTVGPRLRERLVAIATGNAPDPHNWVDVI